METKRVITKPDPDLHGITIWLDSYDDLFSDFDPRTYDHRALSDDFLAELRKLMRETDIKTDVHEFHLLIPASERNTKTEELISHRLHTYFRNAFQKAQKENVTLRRKGILLSVTGLLFLMSAGYISFRHTELLPLHFLMIALEPAGWFFSWIGYENLSNAFSRIKSELEFYRGLMRKKILFKAM